MADRLHVLQHHNRLSKLKIVAVIIEKQSVAFGSEDLEFECVPPCKRNAILMENTVCIKSWPWIVLLQLTYVALYELIPVRFWVNLVVGVAVAAQG